MRRSHVPRILSRHYTSGRPSTFAPQDRVLLRRTSNPTKTILTPPLSPDQVLQSHNGVIAHSSIISQSPRSIIRTNKGVEYRATFPTLDEYITKTARLVTPVYPVDAAALVAILDIRPGDRVFEAGTGHGSVTLALAKAGASITTVEKTRSISQGAEKVVAGFARGVFSAQVEFKVGTPDQHRGGEEEEAYDAAILDLPDPEAYFEDMERGMKTDAVLGVWCPSVTQIAKGLEKVLEERMRLVLERVVEFPPGATRVGAGLRRWDIRFAKVRSAAEAMSVREAENRPEYAVKKEEGVRFEMVCRPMVGEMMSGGGFFAVYRKRAEGEVNRRTGEVVEEMEELELELKLEAATEEQPGLEGQQTEREI